MHRSLVTKVLAVLRASWCVPIVMIPAQLGAQENTTPVSISIPDKIDSELTPFIYVDGVLTGAIDGTVRVPVAAESTIEIGLPQARQPLYSLALGPKQFDRGTANVVMTFYSYGTGNADAVWAGVNLEPNKVQDIQLEPMNTGGFEIKLPRSAYDSYREIIRKLGVDQSNKNWLEAIPKANDESRRDGISHLTAAVNQTESWSGAYTPSVRTSWPSPAYSERDWKITSEPAGARIRTQVGDKGLTNRTVPLPDLSETFVVLQLAGYVDCPHDGEQCTKIDRGTFTELQCTLQRK
ncbi:hypothetical protein [Sinorhizobium sojae]|uniref:hypothetical protein n=1 Tax=Sinorhizobium sojae TaxID=716925 RepID=UPI00055344EC|nr:hypothetical protein [Sinorhizobium sojae]